MQGTITYWDRDYPRRLKNHSEMPKKLYYRGTYEESLFDVCLGIVGSRRMTEYGKKVIRCLCRKLSRMG